MAMTESYHSYDSFDGSSHMPMVDDEVAKVNNGLQVISQMIISNTQAASQHKLNFEQLVLNLNGGNPEALYTSMQHCLMLAQRDPLLRSTMNTINKSRDELFPSFNTTVEMLVEMQKIIVHQRLGRWQRDQALNGNANGDINVATLNQIQLWFESLSEQIWSTRSAVDVMRTCTFASSIQPDIFEAPYDELTTLLKNLIVSGFIVEKQPPQVMKTNTR